MKKGFTLSEVLIVVSVLALVFFTVLANWKTQIARGYDAIRKKHLNDIKRVFEEYYNDKGCYPPATTPTILSNCGGPELQPYIEKVPCDPVGKTPYLYEPLDGDPCRGYRVFASLDDTKDSDIARLGCNGVTGCGFGPEYNYGISAGTSVALAGFNPQAAPTPTPPPLFGGKYACAPYGSCNDYTDPVGMGCPKSYSQADCLNECGIQANRCLH